MIIVVHALCVLWLRYAAFEDEEMPNLKHEFPTLKFSQLKER
jgi:hypothetical protein